jgi:hypothetical protein
MLEARPGPAQPVTAALECAWTPLPPSREAGSYMGAKLSLGSGVAGVAYGSKREDRAWTTRRFFPQQQTCRPDADTAAMGHERTSCDLERSALLAQRPAWYRRSSETSRVTVSPVARSEQQYRRCASVEAFGWAPVRRCQCLARGGPGRLAGVAGPRSAPPLACRRGRSQI